jgi:hypothetical protein
MHSEMTSILIYSTWIYTQYWMRYWCLNVELLFLKMQKFSIKPTIIITDVVIIVNFYVQVNCSNFEQLTVDFKLLFEVCRLRLAVCRKCQS